MIQIGFSRHKSPYAIFSQAIMMFEQRPFSHVYVVLPCQQTQQLMVFQASKNTVNLVSYENFSKYNTVVKEFFIFTDQDKAQSLWKFVFERLGNRYSWTQVVLIAWSRLTGSSYAYENGEEEQICSELAARVAKHLDIEVPYNLDTISPRELYDVLEDQLG